MKNQQSEMFKALSVESRIKIINLLKQRGPLGVNDMAEALGITPSAVSQHLKILRYAGLVRSERKGYCLPYEIDHTAMAQCKEAISEVCNCGCKGTYRELEQMAGDAENTLPILIKREHELQEQLKEVRGMIKGIRKMV